jgi:hypothetical protein
MQIMGGVQKKLGKSIMDTQRRRREEVGRCRLKVSKFILRAPMVSSLERAV